MSNMFVLVTALAVMFLLACGGGSSATNDVNIEATVEARVSQRVANNTEPIVTSTPTPPATSDSKLNLGNAVRNIVGAERTFENLGQVEQSLDKHNLSNKSDAWFILLNANDGAMYELQAEKESVEIEIYLFDDIGKINRAYLEEFQDEDSQSREYGNILIVLDSKNETILEKIISDIEDTAIRSGTSTPTPTPDGSPVPTATSQSLSSSIKNILVKEKQFNNLGQVEQAMDKHVFKEKATDGLSLLFAGAGPAELYNANDAAVYKLGPNNFLSIYLFNDIEKANRRAINELTADWEIQIREYGNIIIFLNTENDADKTTIDDILNDIKDNDIRSGTPTPTPAATPTPTQTPTSTATPFPTLTPIPTPFIPTPTPFPTPFIPTPTPFIPTPTPFIPTPTPVLQLSLVDLVASANESVVQIFTDEGCGTGFIVSKDGLIVTNAHVVKGYNSGVLILRNGDGYFWHALITNRDIDLALIKIYQENLPSLQFADSDSLMLGQKLVVIGYPGNRSGCQTGSASITTGNVSSFRDNLSPWISALQTDAAINPGNSGGPVLDFEGKVIGVASAGFIDTEGMNLAIASDQVKQYINPWVKAYYREKPPRPFPTSTPTPNPSPTPTPTPVPTTFWLGDTREMVLQSAGDPTNKDDGKKIFYYGSSRLYFNYSVSVGDWILKEYNNSDNNLKLTLHKKTGNTFWIGDEQQNVLEAQGNPIRISGNTWYYEQSTVEFDPSNLKVFKWNDPFSNLLLSPHIPNGSKFAIGSTKNKVLEAQGNPNQILIQNTGYFWYFGVSNVRFDSEGKVEGVADIAGILNFDIAESPSLTPVPTPTPTPTSTPIPTPTPTPTSTPTPTQTPVFTVIPVETPIGILDPDMSPPNLTNILPIYGSSFKRSDRITFQVDVDDGGIYMGTASDVRKNTILSYTDGNGVKQDWIGQARHLGDNKWRVSLTFPLTHITFNNLAEISWYFVSYDWSGNGRHSDTYLIDLSGN